MDGFFDVSGSIAMVASIGGASIGVASIGVASIGFASIGFTTTGVGVGDDFVEQAASIASASTPAARAWITEIM